MNLFILQNVCIDDLYYPAGCIDELYYPAGCIDDHFYPAENMY